MQKWKVTLRFMDNWDVTLEWYAQNEYEAREVVLDRFKLFFPGVIERGALIDTLVESIGRRA